MLSLLFIGSLSCFAFTLLYIALHFILIATLLSNEREILLQGWVEIIGFSTFPRWAGSLTQWPCFPECKFEGQDPVANLRSRDNSTAGDLGSMTLHKSSGTEEGPLVFQFLESVAMSHDLSALLIKISSVDQLASNASFYHNLAFSSTVQLRFHLLFKTFSQTSSSTPKNNQVHSFIKTHYCNSSSSMDLSLDHRTASYRQKHCLMHLQIISSFHSVQPRAGTQ